MVILPNADFDINVDVVIQNPPFGTKEQHADCEFLKKAFELAPVIYSFHKNSTKNYIIQFGKSHGFFVKSRISHPPAKRAKSTIKGLSNELKSAASDFLKSFKYTLLLAIAKNG